jgi:CHAT domain-containing protein/Tfp pilus assembly protein PilF
MAARAEDTLTSAVHRSIAAEQFERADAAAQKALAQARGTDKAAEQRRLEALDLLIDSAIAQHQLTSEAAGQWIADTSKLDEHLYGPQSRPLAKPLAVAAMRARRSGAGPQAIQNATELIKQSADIAEHGKGELSPSDEAFVYQAVAALAVEGGRFDQAVAAIQHAEQVLRPPRTDYERSIHALQLTALGTYEQQLGNPAQALADARAGADEAMAASGPQSRVYAGALTDLGKVQFFAADYVEAKATLQSAVAVLRVHPSDVFTMGAATAFLANTMLQLGDFDAARPLYRESVADSRGDARIYLPGRLNGLALLEKNLGNLEASRDLFQQALQLYEEQHDRAYFGLVPVLNNLGVLSQKQDDLASAKIYYQRALDIAAARKGGVIYDVLAAREGLASVALGRGFPQEADDLLAESASELERSFGASHPDLTFIRCEQALAEARLGRLDAAYELAKGSESFRIDLLRRTAPALGEGEMVNLKHRLNDCGGLLLALAATSQKADPIQQAWQLLAGTRGMATHLLSARLAAARIATDASRKESWSAWESAAQRYADVLMHKNVDSEAIGKAREALEVAESKLDTPERTSAGIADVALPELLARQPRQSALVAYFVADQFDLEADARSDPQARRSPTSQRTVYAFVRQAGRTRLVRLGDSATIEFKIDYWNRLLRRPTGDLEQLTAAGRAVREAVWDPLAIGHDFANVFVVPDGALYRVSFAALPDDGGYLVEHGWRTHLLDSERDLAMAAAPARPQRLLLVGSPDFGGGNDAAAVASGEHCASGFEPLPATKVEIERVARLWNEASGRAPVILTGRSASKDALREAVAGSQIIHVATHAAEFDQNCARPATRGMGLAAASVGPSVIGPAALALSGANDFFAHGSSAGILTSEEVVTMPLQGAQWVVLSACDTGLGLLVDGEGVFGLRRAFRLAGARTVIMSLWEVDDGATAEWMEALYRAHLQQRVPVAESIARAQLSVLANRRARGESTHPFYWAAFVASGDWH